MRAIKGTRQRTFLRRVRALAIASIVGLAVLGAFDSGSQSSVSASTAAQVSMVVVQPGDTYWSIARRLQPSGDVRPMVDKLRQANGGQSLIVGQQIRLP